MDYMQLFDSRYLILLFVVVWTLSACASSEQVQDAVQAASTINEPNRAQNNSSVQTSAAKNVDPVIVTYKNKSSNIQITLDPSQDEFYLDLKGLAPNEVDSIVVADSALIENRAKDIQTLLSSYRKAQDLFYLGEYRDALAEVDKTIEIQETADAYALKGTIFFMLENPTAARANWNRAVQLDPNIPVPSIPELETLINDIREDGD